MAYRKKIEQVQRCPFEYGLRVFGGKWNARILCLLSRHTPLRFRQIREELRHDRFGLVIHWGTYACGALKELLAEDVIRRDAYNEIPPRVEYSLTDKGESILPLLRSICAWSRQQQAMDEQALLAPCRQCPRLAGETTGDRPNPCIP